MKYIIYKISIDDYIYIGSTRDYHQRKIRHKHNCSYQNGDHFKIKVYQLIREAGGWDKCEMIPIEEYECENQLQARIREEHWRREYNANMNSKQAYTSIEEKKEHKNEQANIYRQNNKEKIREKHTCDCGGSYSRSSKAIHSKTKKHLEYLERQNIV